MGALRILARDAKTPRHSARGAEFRGKRAPVIRLPGLNHSQVAETVHELLKEKLRPLRESRLSGSWEPCSPSSSLSR
jgi:hypothetical protein